ncbi:MAG: hypothetical protein WA958_19215 [Tunicatimonas sp.]
MKLFVLLVCVWLSACHESDPKAEKKTDEELELDLSRPFSKLYHKAKAGMLEAEAVNKVRDYLLANGMDIDSLYVYKINYTDTCNISNKTSFTSDPIDACIAVFNIEHKVNHDYYSRIDVENARKLKDYEKNNENYSEPLLIPSKPDFLRKEILLHYYFEQDSLVDVLSQ